MPLNNIFFWRKLLGTVLGVKWTVPKLEVDAPRDESERLKGWRMTKKAEEPNGQSQQTVRLNIHEQALLVQFHPNQKLNRHSNTSLSKIVLGPFIGCES